MNWRGFLMKTDGNKTIMEERKHKKLLIIGGTDKVVQHVGGVGMFIHRLHKKLLEPYVANYTMVDHHQVGIWKQLKMIKKADVIHPHVSNPYLRWFYAFASKILGKTSVLTVHGDYGVYKGLRSVFDRLAMKTYDIPILINKGSYEAVKKINPNAVFYPAFILPIEGEEQLTEEEVAFIMKLKTEGKPLFVASSNHRGFTDDGKEVYGIDFLIDYFSSHNDYNLLVLDPFTEYEPLYEGKLPSNVTLFSGAHSLCGVMKLADVVIRNTATDGDAFSVKEALWLHKPVLVTDVVSRPQGVFLFHYNDSKSFEEAISQAMSYKGSIELMENDSIEDYRKLYQKLGVI